MHAPSHTNVECMQSPRVYGIDSGSLCIILNETSLRVALIFMRVKITTYTNESILLTCLIVPELNASQLSMSP
jgi:hypothetical protein